MIIICIGREYGSGGREIGEILSKQLGIPCYDKLLIKKAAMESGLAQEYLENGEETPINIGRFLSGNSFADTAGIANLFYTESQNTYNAEKSVIEKLASKGPCIIIGRCASSILPKESRLSVFIFADEANKVKRVMVRNRISEKEAVQRIRRMDRLRKQFFDFYSDSRWGKTESYDIMLSSSKLGIERCVNLIEACVEEQGEPDSE